MLIQGVDSQVIVGVQVSAVSGVGPLFRVIIVKVTIVMVIIVKVRIVMVIIVIVMVMVMIMKEL